MGSDYREQVVLLEELTAGRVAEEVGTPTDRVVGEELVGLLVAKILQGIGPEEIAHGSISRRFPETIQLVAAMRMQYYNKT